MKKQKQKSTELIIISVIPRAYGPMHVDAAQNVTGRRTRGKCEIMLWGEKERQFGSIFLFATTSVRIIKAKLGMSKAEYVFLAESIAMHKAIKENTLGYFTVLFDGLTDWDDNNILLTAALQALRDGVNGAAGMKTTALGKLKTSLKLALAYVNKLCLASQDTAESIIGAALMKVINQGARVISDIVVKQGKSAASIATSCPAVKVDGKKVVATYQKGYSTDNGLTWSESVSIAQCRYTFLLLRVGVPHIFRSRTISAKTGTSIWVYSRSISPL